MKKFNRLPREQAVAGADDEFGPNHDGLPAGNDVEGHRSRNAESFLPGVPGTGGDNLHRPVGGGEYDEDDVEGHRLGRTIGERLSPAMPGTGGDQAHPPTEDATEGHRIG
ncbi:MAG: hypothetical protein NVS9B8_13560 [Candidatus Limnocylindrales bacterium]